MRKILDFFYIPSMTYFKKEKNSPLRKAIFTVYDIKPDVLKKWLKNIGKFILLNTLKIYLLHT